MNFKTLVLITVFLGASMSASAQNLTAEDRSNLSVVVDQFYEDFEQLDFKGIVEAMPPSVLSDLARRNGLTEAQLYTAFVEVMETSMASVSVLDMGIDVATLTLGTTPAGRIFALLPTHVKMQIGSDVYHATSHTLAFKEKGRWYLLRVDNPDQQQMLVNALPEFAAVTFPEGSLEPVE